MTAGADRPRVRVEISGAPHAGKSVLAAQFRQVLRELGLGFDGPDALPRRSPADLAAAVGNLKSRGLAVEFVETQQGELEQVDARIGWRR